MSEHEKPPEVSMAHFCQVVGQALNDFDQSIAALRLEIGHAGRQVSLLTALMESYDSGIGKLNARLEHVTRVLEGREDAPWSRPWEQTDDEEEG